MIGLFLATIGLSAVMTLVARRAGNHVGLLDVPDAGRKRHVVAVPALGGIAVFAAFAIIVSARCLVEPAFANALSGPMAVLLASAAVVWGLGIVDDIELHA